MSGASGCPTAAAARQPAASGRTRPGKSARGGGVRRRRCRPGWTSTAQMLAAPAALPSRISSSLVKASAGNSCRAAASGVDRVAAILGDLVLAAVLVAMVVLEAQAGGGAGDDPGARVVVGDVERDADRVGRTFADVHHQALAGEAGVGGGGRADDAAFERLAAQRREVGEEVARRRGGRGAAGGGEEQESGKPFHRRRPSRAPCSARMRTVRMMSVEQGEEQRDLPQAEHQGEQARSRPRRRHNWDGDEAVGAARDQFFAGDDDDPVSPAGPESAQHPEARQLDEGEQYQGDEVDRAARRETPQGGEPGGVESRQSADNGPARPHDRRRRAIGGVGARDRQLDQPLRGDEGEDRDVRPDHRARAPARRR